MGGKILFNESVNKIIITNSNINKIYTSNNSYNCDYVFSSMPIKDLINTFNKVPKEINKIANNLEYRDFITVGLLIRDLEIKNLTDNWIYIQESDVNIGRLQIFNNWSPYLVKDKNTKWIGLEYFCNETDALWNMPKKDFIKHATSEMIKLGFISNENLLDTVQIKVKKPILHILVHMISLIK